MANVVLSVGHFFMDTEDNQKKPYQDDATFLVLVIGLAPLAARPGEQLSIVQFCV